MTDRDAKGLGGGYQAIAAAIVRGFVHDAIVEERFLILPHPEVGDYLRHKGDDPARWISGMQRLQQRTLGL